MESQEYYAQLVMSLDKFREMDFLCDTVLVTDDKREHKAHSVVLAAASSVFRTAFATASERGPGPLQVNLREYESDIVEIALQFMYTGKLLHISNVFAQKNDWSRLIAVLERLGLDMQLVDQCEKSFQDSSANVWTEKSFEERSRNAVITRGGSVDSDDTFQRQTEPGCIDGRPLDQNVRPAKRRKTASRRNFRKKKKVQRPRRRTKDSAAKNDSEIGSLPNGDVSFESLSDGTAAAVGSGPCSWDPTAQMYVCQTCGRSFAKKERLILHERTHSGERPYACETCGRRFSLASNLRRHMPLHSGQKPFMCELCGRTFIRRAYLEDHLAVHVTARPYACSSCPKRFNSHGQLRLHNRYVHDRSAAAANRRWYPCEVCNKNFSSKGNLRTHFRIHTGERPFVCACGKAYAQRIQLVQHSRLHSDERPFSCDTCGRSFRFRGSLVIHNRTHTGERPHICEHCGKSYTNKAGLRTHTARMHAVKNNDVSVKQPLLAVLMS